MSTEKQVEKIEQELKAIKASFEYSATSMKIYKYENIFTTSMNALHITPPPSYDPMDWLLLWHPILYEDKTTSIGAERIEVTFICEGNRNTIASLEIELLQHGEGLRPVIVERKIYSGGARWIVRATENTKMVGTTGYYSWSPNIIRFVVKSSVPGQLGVKMIWQ